MNEEMTERRTDLGQIMDQEVQRISKEVMMFILERRKKVRNAMKCKLEYPDLVRVEL